MCATPTAERRQHQRCPMTGPVEFHHEASGRDFTARGVDVSAGGMLMYVSAVTPVKPGQPIRVKARGVTQTQPTAKGEVPAEIVRVDRYKLLSVGQVAIGVKFL